MENIVSLAYGNLTSPMVLCFILGVSAALMRSDLSIPQAVAKGMSIYLLFAIGIKGGVEIAKQGISLDLITIMGLGVVLSLLIPWIGFHILRLTTKLSAIDAAAVSAHYGSISIVTFVATTQVLENAGLDFDKALVAVAAVMEAPAIISALYILRQNQNGNKAPGSSEQGLPLREVFLNGSIVLLVGSFLIGLLSGEKGFATIKPLISDPFKGVLCFFLLDMGLLAGRHLKEGIRYLKLPVLLYGIYMPMLSALICLILALPFNLEPGSLTLLVTLAASASYIAVPAAMRIALPKANPGIYITLSLAVTFPFNLTFGIPTYLALAQFFSK